MKSPSHKKNRILSADIKKQYSVVTKKARLVSKLPRSSSLVAYNRITPSAISMPTPIRQKVKDSFYKVTSSRLNLSFRSFCPSKDIFANIVLHTSKEINSNLNLKQKHHTTSNRRSLRH